MAILQIFGSVYFNVEAAPGFGAQPWAINFGGYFYDKAAAGSKYRRRLARFRDAASGFNGNTGSIPGVIFHLRYEPSTYRDSNNRNCAREAGSSKAFQVTPRDVRPSRKISGRVNTRPPRAELGSTPIGTANRILEVFERRDRALSPCNSVIISRIIWALFCNWPRIFRLAVKGFLQVGRANSRMIAERSQ
jgi:hypothetical protein